MIGDIKKLVREYGICQTVKYENMHPAGLLQPLLVPNQPWTDIAMDFIEGLPGFNIRHQRLMDFLSFSLWWTELPNSHFFLTLAHPYTTVKVAQVFFTGVFKLHGMPKSIVSYRDPIFMSSFLEGTL